MLMYIQCPSSVPSVSSPANDEMRKWLKSLDAGSGTSPALRSDRGKQDEFRNLGGANDFGAMGSGSLHTVAGMGGPADLLPRDQGRRRAADSAWCAAGGGCEPSQRARRSGVDRRLPAPPRALSRQEHD